MKQSWLGLCVGIFALSTALYAKAPHITPSKRVLAKVVKVQLDFNAKTVDVLLVEYRKKPGGPGIGPGPIPFPGGPINPVPPVVRPGSDKSEGPPPLQPEHHGMKEYNVELDINDAFDSALYQALIKSGKGLVMLTLNEDGQIGKVTMVNKGCGCGPGCGPGGCPGCPGGGCSGGSGGCNGGGCGVGGGPGTIGVGPGCSGGSCSAGSTVVDAR